MNKNTNFFKSLFAFAKILILLLFLNLFLLSNHSFLVSKVYAQKNEPQNLICDLFPFLRSLQFGVSSFCEKKDGQEAVRQSAELIRFILSLIFVAIVIIAIYVIIKAALTYIQSEGNEEKVKQAKKAIQNVFIGIGALFVGLIGLIVVLAFFGASGAVQTEVPNAIKNFLPTEQK